MRAEILPKFKFLEAQEAVQRTSEGSKPAAVEGGGRSDGVSGESSIHVVGRQTEEDSEEAGEGED